MNFEEFLKPRTVAEPPLPVEAEDPAELDVQKAVVESLAAEKVEQDEELNKLRQQLEELSQQLAAAQGELAAVKSDQAAAKSELESAQSELAAAKNELAAAQSDQTAARNELATAKGELTAVKSELAETKTKLVAELERECDCQERNPNALALLDREVELPDRFPGESRDHVLEALREARDRAEADGRVRRAQVLEGVLVANEPNGTLAERRRELEKLFADNSNIINGEVINLLNKRGISHKNGEEYLLPSEIIKRNF